MVVTQLKKESQNVVIRLDHNMDFLKSYKHESTQELINHNLERGMLPTVTHLTRITNTSATLIDNIIVSMNYVGKYTCTILVDNISDHLPSIFSLSWSNSIQEGACTDKIEGSMKTKHRCTKAIS